MASSPKTRELSWTAATTVIAVLAAIAFAALGLRGLLDPTGASVSFGVGEVSGNGALMMQATGARNLALALVAMLVLAIDDRRSLALILMGAGAIAAIDFLIVWQGAGIRAAPKHAAYAVSLSLFGAHVWRWRSPS